MKFFVVFACALAAVSAGYVTPIYHGPQHLAVIGKGGVPIDTAEVQHAGEAHFLHLAEAEAISGHGDYYEGSSSAGYAAPAYHGPQHLAVIGKGGVPIDTVEVQRARAAHFLHKAEAEAISGHYEEPSAAYAQGAQTYGYSTKTIHAPVYNHGSSYGYQPHVPIIVKGVPVDTIAVQKARAAHFAAHAAASAKAYENYYHHY